MPHVPYPEDGGAETPNTPYWVKHAITALVAAGLVALAVADGAYYPRALTVGVIVAWWLIMIPVAIGLWPRSRVPGAALGAGLALGLLAFLTALSLAWTNDDGRAFVEIVRAAGYTGLFVLIVVASRRGEWRPWIAGIAIGTGIVAVLALVSRFEPSLLDDSSAGEIARALNSARGRLSFPVGYWNALAGLCAVGFATLVWAGAASVTRWARALATAVAPLTALAIFYTSSRGGYAALALALAVMLAAGPDRFRLLFTIVVAGAGTAVLTALAAGRDELAEGLAPAVAERQGDEMLLACLIVVLACMAIAYACDGVVQGIRPITVPRGVKIGVALLAAVAMVAAVVALDPAQRWDDFRELPTEQQAGGTAHLGSGSGSGRWQFWTTAADAFTEEPIAGQGAGEFEAYWTQHGELVAPIRNAHSLPLELAAEVGIGGLLLILGFAVIVVLAGVDRARRGSPGAGIALAIFVAGYAHAAVDWTWELPAVFGIAVVAAALLTGPATEPSENAVQTSSPARLGWRVAAVLAGIVSVWAAGVVLFSETKLEDSRAEVRAGDLDAAADDAADAVALQPWAAEPELQEALVSELQGDLDLARDQLDDAIADAPDDWRLWVVAARLEVKLGDTVAAREAFARARELNPKAFFLAPTG